MTFKRLITRGGPIFLLGLLAFSTGFVFGKRIPDELWWLPTASALLFLVLLQIFKQVARLNLLLMLGFSLSLGSLLPVFDLWVDLWFPILILLLGLGLALLWAYLVGLHMPWMGVLFFFLTLAYLLGWGILFFLTVPVNFELIWASIGILLFLGLGVYMLTQARYAPPQEQVVPIVSDLFVVYGNLFWVSAILVNLVKSEFG
jgi:hypothetical protein